MDSFSCKNRFGSEIKKGNQIRKDYTACEQPKKQGFESVFHRIRIQSVAEYGSNPDPDNIF
jgi:hypothetical protein